MKTMRTVLLAAMVAAGCASAMAAEPEQASIPFVNQSQSIHGWQADGQQGIWIEDARKNWFYAKLQAPCMGLEFAAALKFEPKTMNSLDRFGYVVVPNNARCPIASLTKSAAPPKEKKGKAK
ncbi:MAG: DUF6491 family protein [Steroidobacteraceae bacterium]